VALLREMTCNLGHPTSLRHPVQVCRVAKVHAMPNLYIGCIIFTGHVPQKSPIIRGSFAERDLQFDASSLSSPHYYTWRTRVHTCVDTAATHNTFVSHDSFIHTSTHCVTLQHTATHCSILQHTIHLCLHLKAIYV